MNNSYMNCYGGLDPAHTNTHTQEIIIRLYYRNDSPKTKFPCQDHDESLYPKASFLFLIQSLFLSGLRSVKEKGRLKPSSTSKGPHRYKSPTEPPCLYFVVKGFNLLGLP